MPCTEVEPEPVTSILSACATGSQPQPQPQPKQDTVKWINPGTKAWTDALNWVKDGKGTVQQLASRLSATNRVAFEQDLSAIDAQLSNLHTESNGVNEKDTPVAQSSL